VRTVERKGSPIESGAGSSPRIRTVHLGLEIDGLGWDDENKVGVCGGGIG
jgi:hypothetical protein